MITRLKNFIEMKRLYIVLLLFSLPLWVKAQSLPIDAPIIQGPAQVYQGAICTYTIATSNGFFEDVEHYTWELSGKAVGESGDFEPVGEIVAQHAEVDEQASTVYHTIQVRWFCFTGPRYVHFFLADQHIDSQIVNALGMERLMENVPPTVMDSLTHVHLCLEESAIPQWAVGTLLMEINNDMLYDGSLNTVTLKLYETATSTIPFYEETRANPYSDWTYDLSSLEEERDYYFEIVGVTGCSTAKHTFSWRKTIQPTMPTLTTTAKAFRGSHSLLTVAPQEGIIYHWYDKNLQLLHTGESYTTENLPVGKDTLYVEAAVAINGIYACVSPKLLIPVTIWELPVIYNKSGSQRRQGESATLAIRHTHDGDEFEWHEGQEQDVLSYTEELEVFKEENYWVRITREERAITVSHDFMIFRQDRNYVVENTILTDGITSRNATEQLSIKDIDQQVTYYDGLGRELQTVHTQGTATQKDLITYHTYDATGRKTATYLPYATPELGRGRYDSQNVQNQQAYYGSSENWDGEKQIYQTAYPYSQPRYEASLQGRVLEQSAPGESWQLGSHTIQYHYRYNRTDELRKWTYDYATKEVSASSFYPAHQLRVVETTDEQDNQVYEYKDTDDKTLLLKTVAATDSEGAPTAYHETYFIYDDLRLLRMVISPEGVKALQANGWAMNEDIRTKWCYTYDYDEEHRMIEKQLPSTAPLYMVYNQRDLLVLSQDGNQRARGQWLFYKYDALDREVLQGLYYSEESRTQLQAAADTAAYLYEQLEAYSTDEVHHYTNQAFPVLTWQSDNTPVDELLLISYYDTYNLDGDFSDIPEIATPAHYDPRTQGLPTITKTKLLGTDQYTTAANFYDEHGRVTTLQETDHLGFTNAHTYVYDFVGRMTHDHYRRYNDDTTLIATDRRFTYDRQGRQTHIEQKLAHETSYQRLARYEYNDLGQVVRKSVGRYGFGRFTYQYNSREWLTQLEGDLAKDGTRTDLFQFWLYYDQPDGLLQLAKIPQYNGNIAGMKWKKNDVSHSYAYTYDPLNRLTNAYYIDDDALVSVTKRDYFEGNIQYDANGNITRLQRKGIIDYQAVSNLPTYGLVDDLQYSYEGNQLKNIRDAAVKVSEYGDFQDGNDAATTGADDYAYDNNGNLLLDRNKKIVAIAYNHLNLPSQICFDDNCEDRIAFLYDATGKKYRQEVYEAGNLESYFDYTTEAVYHNDRLLFLHTPEGRAVANYLGDFTLQQEYHISDHLGNLRYALRETEDATYMATLDSDNNEGGFRNLAETRSSGGYMGSNASKTDATQPVGVWKTLRVQQGDALQLAAVAKYTSTANNNQGTRLSPILSNIGNTGGGVDSGTEPEWLLGISITPGSNAPEAGLPVAQLTAVLYDETGQHVLATQTKDITTEAHNAWETLTLDWEMPHSGLLQVSVVNAADVAVWFDNVTITHETTPIVQENHYYAFGGPLQGLDVSGQPNHAFTYNGKERIKDFGLDWYDYGARMYDWQAARWFNMDPLAEEMGQWTPFNYGFNNPMRFIDPDGMKPNDWGMNQQFHFNHHNYSVDNNSFSPLDDFYFDEQGELDYVVQTARADNFYQADGQGDYHEISIKEGGELSEQVEAFKASGATFDRGVWSASSWLPNEMLIGEALIVSGQDIIHKNSRLAKFIYPGSRVVKDATSNTSLSSLAGRRALGGVKPIRVGFLPRAISLGGQLGRAIPYVGYAFTAYDIATFPWQDAFRGATFQGAFNGINKVEDRTNRVLGTRNWRVYPNYRW